MSDIGITSDRTPVILKSTLFDKSPSSYPKIVSFARTLSAVLIPVSYTHLRAHET